MSINYLITGANRGIGLALTAEVLRNKEKVISLCRESSDSDKLVSLQNANPGLAELRKADVTVEKDLINASKNIVNYDGSYFYIGGDVRDSRDWFNGKISSIKIYTDALTPLKTNKRGKAINTI